MLWLIMIHNRHTNDAYGHMNEHGIHYTKHIISVTYPAKYTSILPDISCTVGLEWPNIYTESGTRTVGPIGNVKVFAA